MSKVAMIGQIHEDGWKILKQKNYDVFEITDLSKENLIKELKEVDAVALRTATLYEDVLMHCPKIKIISRHGVGYNNVDLDYLNQHKKALAVTGTSNAVSVAEHVMTMFLYLAKKINKSDILVRTNEFMNKSSIGNFFELYQKNILILGFGRIGQAVAKRCKGFDVNILVYDPFVDKEIIQKNDYRKVNFDDGIKEADFITIHMPLSDQTKNLINKKEFEQMKNNAIIVNTARGGIINEQDLYWALKNKKIYGAGTDVFEIEPPNSNNPLFTLDNILLSPHNAALTLECRKRMAIETVENIIFYLEDHSKLNKQNIINRKIFNL
jgi:D-3-phosphoglycerate dehydrogenase